MKFKTIVIYTFGGLLAALGIFLLVVFQTDIVVTQFKPSEPAVVFQAAQLTPAPQMGDSLVFMDWNVKFAGGRLDFFFDCYGDRVLMTEQEVLKHLAGLAAKINQVKPDVLFVQEIDIAGDRGAHINQLQWLLDHTELNYAVYASQWDAYIPKHGLGSVNSGNAILSRYPLKNGVRHALPLVESQDALERFFYLRRNMLTATLPLGADSLQLLVTHLDAYAKDDTRLKQLKILGETADKMTSKGQKIVFGGDLNSLPPGTRKLKSFDDTACKEDSAFVFDDYGPEQQWLDPLYARYRDVIELERYHADETKYYSHTVNGRGFWNRRLDYLFTNAQWRANSGFVHQNAAAGGMETMPLSDHAPITGVLLLK